MEHNRRKTDRRRSSRTVTHSKLKSFVTDACVMAIGLGSGINRKSYELDAMLVTLDRETRLVTDIMIGPLRAPARRLRFAVVMTLSLGAFVGGIIVFVNGIEHSPDQGYLWRGLIGLVIGVLLGAVLADLASPVQPDGL